MQFSAKSGENILRFFLRARRGTKMAQAAISLCFSRRAASLPISGSIGLALLLTPSLKACKHWAAGLFRFSRMVDWFRQFAAVFGGLRQKNGTKMAQNGRARFQAAETHPIGCPIVSTF